MEIRLFDYGLKGFFPMNVKWICTQKGPNHGFQRDLKDVFSHN